jgi:hypothetical protein
MAYDEATAERVRKVLTRRRGVVEKKMGGLSFMLKGAMCCSVSGRGGILVRVGADGQERGLAEPHVEPMGVGRRVMTGFVRVRPQGYRTAAALKKWIERRVDFVAAMPKAASAKRKNVSAKRAASARTETRGRKNRAKK